MEKRLRIALIIDTYFPMIDGVVMVVDSYARRLQEHADVTVFCPTVDKHFRDDYPYRVVRCKSFKPFFLDYVAPTPRLDRAFCRTLREMDFDIVHIHSPFAIASLGVRYAKRCGIPVVATLHSQYRQDIKKSVKWGFLTDRVLAHLMKTFNRCDECFAVNRGMLELYQSEYGLTAPAGVKHNASDFLPVADRAAARARVRERFGAKEGERLFLFVGRINFIKNIPFILDALAILHARGFAFRMVFVGGGSDSDALRARAKELGLEEHVTLAGEIRDRHELEEVYAASDLFLFPSLYDANSLVQIEAASQGLPTLFIREAKTASSCIEDHNAFMSANDPTAYADRIERIFEDEELYTKVSKNAQSELYTTWDDSVRELLVDYERILAEHAKHTKA